VMARALAAKVAFWMAFMMSSPLLSLPEHGWPRKVTGG
jgi:hypothetical protein